jgi:hypothetical protein
MNIVELMKQKTNYTTTENRAVTHKTSNSDVLDYFAQGSALRNRTEESILKLFGKSFFENPLLTMKILFYSRDVRGGQGERDTFRTIITHLAKCENEALRKNLHLIPEYGRWDDLFCLLDTPFKKDVLKIIAKQLKEDMDSETPSLLGKWMKSENTSSPLSKEIAKKLRKGLKLSPREYRKTLSKLRKKISIVETSISQKRYDEIEYGKIPSGASLKYREAFRRNDYERYSTYLEALAEGKEKVNVKTLYPYELVRKADNYNFYKDSQSERSLLNSMWNALPDYVNGAELNDLAVVDVSGSMTCDNSVPLFTAISLGMYVAEKNNGPFKNHFITFSETPEIVKIKGNDFVERVQMMEEADWGYSTNLEAVFDLILETALLNKLSQEDIPNRLFIISDMEFNSATRRCSVIPLMKSIENRFKKHGYTMPKIVFWNVASHNDNIPMTMDESGVQLVSGANPKLFEALIKGEMLDAYKLMMSVIDVPRYEAITI